MGQGAPTGGWRPQRWAGLILPLQGEAGAGGDAGARARLPGHLAPRWGWFRWGCFLLGVSICGGAQPPAIPLRCAKRRNASTAETQGETEAQGLKRGISSRGPRSPVPGCGGLPGVTAGGGAPGSPFPVPRCRAGVPLCLPGGQRPWCHLTAGTQGHPEDGATSPRSGSLAPWWPRRAPCWGGGGTVGSPAPLH